jgi:hypothetical protein
MMLLFGRHPVVYNETEEAIGLMSFLWLKKEETERKEEEIKERKKKRRGGGKSTYSVSERISCLTSRRWKSLLQS